jgi:HK97 gp10 family phage protein
MIATIQSQSIWNGGELTRDMFRELQESMLKSAQRIAADARQNCPVGATEHKFKGRSTGHLRDTIRARPGRKGKEKAVVRGLVSGEYETALPVAYVFAGNRRVGVYWHYFVEYGTYNSPAYPFMRPAVDRNFNPVLAEAERAGRRAINARRRELAAARRAKSRTA